MRAVAILTLSLGLVGCVTAPKAPSPAQVSQTHADITRAIGSMSPVQYADAGMHYVDVRCDQFFEDAKSLDRRTAAAQGAASRWGGTLTGILAAENRSAENIAIAALLFSGIDAQIGNYREQELLGPFASSAHLMVTQARDVFRRQPAPVTASEAVHRVHQYGQLCSITTIHRFINDAVSLAKPALVSGDAPLLSAADRTVVDGAISLVAPNAGVTGLTTEEWTRLYVYLSDAPGDDELVKAFATDYPAQRASLLASTSPYDRTTAGNAVLTQLSALRARIPAFAAATQEIRALRAQAQQDAANAAALHGVAATEVGLPYRSTTTGGVVVIR